MKTLAELEALRKTTLDKINMRKDNVEGVRIVVGMATCGIAAGARPVLNAFMEEVSKRSLSNITVTQVGCMGLCQYEPMVEIHTPDGEKVTYVNITPEKVAKIVADHLVNGKVVNEYTVGSLKK